MSLEGLTHRLGKLTQRPWEYFHETAEEKGFTEAVLREGESWEIDIIELAESISPLNYEIDSSLIYERSMNELGYKEWAWGGLISKGAISCLSFEFSQLGSHLFGIEGFENHSLANFLSISPISFPSILFKVGIKKTNVCLWCLSYEIFVFWI